MYTIQTKGTMDEILNNFLRHVEQFHKTLGPPHWFPKQKGRMLVSQTSVVGLKIFLMKALSFSP